MIAPRISCLHQNCAPQASRAEVYAGDSGMKAQLRYADRRNAAIAGDRRRGRARARGEVTLKDLALGAELAKSVESRAAWVKDRPAQISFPRTELILGSPRPHRPQKSRDLTQRARRLH